MSLDLSIPIGEVEELVCHHCDQPYKFQETASFNYTYNASRMWYAASPESKQMIPIEGMTGEESLKILKPAYKEMLNNPDKYKLLEPSNGWGSYATFLTFVWQLIQAAEDNPKNIWSAGR